MSTYTAVLQGDGTVEVRVDFGRGVSGTYVFAGPACAARAGFPLSRRDTRLANQLECERHLAEVSR